MDFNLYNNTIYKLLDSNYYKNIIIYKLYSNNNFLKLTVYSIIIMLIVNSLFGFESESIIAITVFSIFTIFGLYFNYKLYNFFENQKQYKINLVQNMQYNFLNVYLILLYKLLDLYYIFIIIKGCYYNNLLQFLYNKIKYIINDIFLQQLIYFLQIYFEICFYINNNYYKINNYYLCKNYINFFNILNNNIFLYFLLSLEFGDNIEYYDYYFQINQLFYLFIIESFFFFDFIILI